MTYAEVLENARKVMASKCRVYKVRNGNSCKGEIPGVGGRGIGRSFTICRDFFDSVKIDMDTIHDEFVPNLTCNIIQKKSHKKIGK